METHSGPPPPQLLPPSWVHKVDRTAHILSLASIIGATIAMLTFLVFPSKRAYPTRLPLNVMVATLGVSVSVFLGTVDIERACAYEAVGIEFFGLASVAWWLIISYNFYRAAVLHRGTSPAMESTFLLIGWGLPAIVTVICVICHQLDTKAPPVGWECWMANEHGKGQWIFFYGEMGVACLIGLYIWPQGLYRVFRLHLASKTSDTVVSKDQVVWPRGLATGLLDSDSDDHDGTESPSYGSTGRSTSTDAERKRASTGAPNVVVSHARHVLFVLMFQIVFGVMLAYRIVKDVSGKEDVGYRLTMAHTASVASTGIWAFLVFFLSRRNLRLWGHLLGQCMHCRIPSPRRADVAVAEWEQAELMAVAVVSCARADHLYAGAGGGEQGPSVVPAYYHHNHVSDSTTNYTGMP